MISSYLSHHWRFFLLFSWSRINFLLSFFSVASIPIHSGAEMPLSEATGWHPGKSDQQHLPPSRFLSSKRRCRFGTDKSCNFQAPTPARPGNRSRNARGSTPLLLPTDNVSSWGLIRNWENWWRGEISLSSQCNPVRLVWLRFLLTRSHHNWPQFSYRLQCWTPSVLC